MTRTLRSLDIPDEADLSSMKLSVFSPIGTAILATGKDALLSGMSRQAKPLIDIKKILISPRRPEITTSRADTGINWSFRLHSRGV